MNGFKLFNKVLDLDSLRLDDLLVIIGCGMVPLNHRGSQLALRKVHDKINVMF